jgi:glutamate/tyrosine decarboxylase-like PLP-dependent enzyme
VRLDHPDADRRCWAIKEKLNESGFAYISSTVLHGRRVLRIVVMNPRTTADDICDVMRRVEKIAIEMGGGTGIQAERKRRPS